MKEIMEEKESLEIQLDSSKIDLETSKEEIEMLKREILRLINCNNNDPKHSLKNPNISSLQRINNINNFGKRFCLKFLKSIKGDDTVSDMDSCFDDQGKFTTGRFQTSPDQMRNFVYSNSDEITEENEKDLEKRYTAKEMNRLRKEIVEYEQIIKFLSQNVKSSLPQNQEEVEQKLLDYIKDVSDLEANKDNMKNLFEENNKLSQRVLELEEKTATQETFRTQTELTSIRNKDWEQQKQKLHEQIGEYQSKIIQLEQDKTNIKEDLKKENERLQNIINQYKSGNDLGRIEEYEKTIQKLNQSISVWKTEFQRLEMLKKENPQAVYEKAFEILKQKFATFEKSFDLVAKQNQDLNIKIKNLQQELVASNKKIAELSFGNNKEEKTREKWLSSYNEMEEIVRVLESRKESMQNQLIKMREIIESNNQEIFELTEINQRQEHENQLLIQEVLFFIYSSF